MPNPTDFQSSALATLRIEQQALDVLATQINDSFNQACEILLQCKGRVVITGMGKSGHIGRKMAATFASTGTPSFFCLLYTSPSPRDRQKYRMPSSA